MNNDGREYQFGGVEHESGPPAPEPKRTNGETESLADLVGRVPNGFRARLDIGGRTLRITYRRRGMGCLVLFLSVWLAGWTAGGIAAITALSREFGWFILVWLGGWAVGELAVTYFLAWLLFGSTEIVLEPDRLVVDKVLFGWHRTSSVERSDIREIAQVKDGGEGDDSFPSWGLNVMSDEKVSVLARQEYEKGAWLCRVLSVWAGRPFVEARPPE